MHVNPPPIPQTKNKNDEKSGRDCVKNKLHRGLTSQKSDLYDFKMALFYHGDPAEFLLFIRNFNMTLEASETIVAGANIQYLCTLVRGYELRQFYTLTAEVGSTTP